MRIEHAFHIYDDAGCPLLQVFLNGQPARIDPEQKFLDQDIVVLPASWRGKVDPIEIPGDEKDARGALTLENAVRDKRLAAMTRRFRDAVFTNTFHLASVEIPQETGND